MTYEKHDQFIRRLADGACIPLDPANRDYADFLEWEAKGNVAGIPPPTPAAIPQVISRFQGQAALDAWQLLDAAEAIIADATTPKIVKIGWGSWQEFERQSPTLIHLAGLLGLTEAQLDDLFILGASIRV